MIEEKKTFLCLTLKPLALIILIISFIGTIVNFVLYGTNSQYTDSVRYAFIIECIIDIPLIIIGAIGIYGRKPTCVKAYGFYLLIRIFFNLVITLDFVLPTAKNVAAGGVIFGLAIRTALELYFLYVFLTYSHELKKEKREEKEISGLY